MWMHFFPSHLQMRCPLTLTSTLITAKLPKIFPIKLLERRLHQSSNILQNQRFSPTAHFSLSQHSQKSQILFTFQSSTLSSSVKSCQPLPLTLFSSRRTLSTDSGQFVGKTTIDKFHHMDGLPKTYTLIYRSPFNNYLLGSQLAIFVGTLASLLATILYLVSLANPETEEEKAERKLKQQEDLDERRKKQDEGWINKTIESLGLESVVNMFPSKPEFEDVVLAEENPEGACIAAVCMLSLAISLIRLISLLPVRIYTNPKKHCVAIKYGHIIPGKRTNHEFVAGSVRPVKNQYKWLAGTLYQDGSGRKFLLFDDYFRYPADLHRLMGIGKDFYEDEENIESYENKRNTK